MADAIADIMREVNGLRAHRNKVEIKTGSLDGLIGALSRRARLTDKRLETGVTNVSFMGIDVVETDSLPSNTAVILSNGEIVNIIKFAAA